jgi:hypothetical protein
MDSSAISISEQLSRFVLHHSHVKTSDGTVKHAAFLPKDGQTSVFRISGITDSDIWDIGNDEVALIRKLPLVGRADISVAAVLKTGLQVASQEPPPRHANIVNWPDEKSAQRLKAMELAAEAQYSPRPSPAR